MRNTAVGLLAGLMALVPAAAGATTKGLNQIVTPDVQPYRVLSLSLQGQDARIGNPLQIQYEAGLARGFEVAAFQGLQPGQFLWATEVSLVEKRPWLLSTGALNWSPQNGGAHPFLEGGYYHGPHELILGVQWASWKAEAIAGYAYQQSSHFMLQADYISGSENFVTFGCTYYATPSFSINPALYVSNSSSHSPMGYIVASYNVHF